MGAIDTERTTAEIDGDFVIYINGMRLNKLRAVHKWLLAGRKLAKMFDRLEADPDSGLLGYQPAFMGVRSGAVIQYWRSLEDIRRFARDPDDLHVPAWKWYEEAVGDSGEVGFWAELYVIRDGNYETFYRNIHPVGLGAVANLVPASERDRRLGLSEEGTPMSEPGRSRTDDGGTEP